MSHADEGDGRAVAGRIALLDRGTCGFVVKAKNAQNAGAIAVVIADNVAGSPPPGMAGVDPTVVIPAVRITLADANAKHFKDQVAFWNEASEHGSYDDFWKARNLRPHLKEIRPAVMTVGGWFDAENLFGTL